MADSRPDGFDFLSDGTTLCFIDGEKWKLRRPKTGEFKQLRLAVRARDDEMSKLSRDTAAATTRPEGAELTEEESAALLATVRELTRELTDRQEALDKEWFAEVFRVLADKPLPSSDDDVELGDSWPVWLWQGQNVTKFLDHWKADPLARGPQ